MQKALVNRIISFSSVDGPGNRTAVFLQGCGYECKYCHNPETIKICQNCGKCVSFCKTGALSYKDNKVDYDISKCVMCDECIKHCKFLSCPRTRLMSSDEVIKEVMKNYPFIRGMTVSGGECTGWRDFLVELLKKAKENGLNTLLDSNGSYLFEKDPELMAVTDGVMLDVKAFNEKEHEALTGCKNENVKRNLFFLLKENKLTEVRTVVTPDLFNAEETVRAVSEILVKAGRPSVKYKIIKYRVNGVRSEFRDITPPSDEYLEKLKKISLDMGLTDAVIT